MSDRTGGGSRGDQGSRVRSPWILICEDSTRIGGRGNHAAGDVAGIRGGVRRSRAGQVTWLW